MKEYHVRRSDNCPTGEHVQIQERAGGQAEVTVDCTCPWLVIRSNDPVPHVMQWGSKAELERLIKEFDSGYFDPKTAPPRRGSHFLSAHIAALLEQLEHDRAGAAMRLLTELGFDQLWYDPAVRVLSLRIPFARQGEHDWRHLHLPFDADNSMSVSRGAQPDTDDLFMLWRRETVLEGTVIADPATTADLRDQIRAITGGWIPADEPPPARTDHEVSGIFADGTTAEFGQAPFGTPIEPVNPPPAEDADPGMPPPPTSTENGDGNGIELLAVIYPSAKPPDELGQP